MNQKNSISDKPEIPPYIQLKFIKKLTLKDHIVHRPTPLQILDIKKIDDDLSSYNCSEVS